MIPADTESEMSEQDQIVEFHALVDLTEANVSPAADGEAWKTEVDFLTREESAVRAPTQEMIDEVLEEVATSA